MEGETPPKEVLQAKFHFCPDPAGELWSLFRLDTVLLGLPGSSMHLAWAKGQREMS